MLSLRWSLVIAACALSACPFTAQQGTPLEPGTRPKSPGAAPAEASTHAGLISIQDVSIAGLPQAGHGLTILAAFTAQRAPDFEDQPGTPFGCKVSDYDLSREQRPAETDQGTLHVDGIRGGAVACVFRAGAGYVCPTAHGQTETTVAIGPAGATYRLADVQLTAADVGRYLQVSGAGQPQNNGAFSILDVSAAGVSVANPRAVSEMFEAQYHVIAGAGPTPRDLYAPYLEATPVKLALEPAADAAFAAFSVEIIPGAAFTLDSATQALITHIEPHTEALTLGCSGTGGDCGDAAASVIRISTTDADVSMLGPTAMPPAEHGYVEITCALRGVGSITIPKAAMELLSAAHARSPITRIRTAFMREGFAFAGSATATPPNRSIVLIGHGVLGFSAPRADR